MPTFPGGVLETLHLRVVRDLAASRSYYVDVLGASVVRQMGEDLVFLELAGIKIVLSVEGGPTADKPTVSFLPPPDPDVVHAELIIRVRDAEEVYLTLSARGATFLTPPVEEPWETRCFIRDPDGYLIEITQPPAERYGEGVPGLADYQTTTG